MLKDLQDLINANIISQDTAEKIQEYYRLKQGNSSSRQFTVFAVLGALLVGSGIVLIVAHNWDTLSITSKTIFAFLPLILGQILCGYALIAKNESSTWKESTSLFLFFAVATCMSLVSQIYNINGNLATFMKIWMLLTIPLVYLMNASITSLSYILGTTFFATISGYNNENQHLYWLLLLLVLPHYFLLYQRKPDSNYITFHNWLVPLSLLVTLGTFAKDHEQLMTIAYMSLLGLYVIIGSAQYFEQRPGRNNGYRFIGMFGTLITLLWLSFDNFWTDLERDSLSWNELINAPEFVITSVISMVTLGLLTGKKNLLTSIGEINPFSLVFIIFIITFMAGTHSPFIAVVVVNVTIFCLGLLVIREGTIRNHLGILNFGLLIIAALVLCRYFDEGISFIIRGTLFVLTGVGFFIANLYMIRKRKAHE